MYIWYRQQSDIILMSDSNKVCHLLIKEIEMRMNKHKNFYAIIKKKKKLNLEFLEMLRV